MVPKVGDLVFVDTNVFLTATDESRPNHEAARRLIAESGSQGLHLAVSGQVLREYLAVATRPVDANGLGLDTRDAVANVNAFLRHVGMYQETGETASRLRRLGLEHHLRGKRFHDANIVATMSVHGIRSLVTDNVGDFASFSEIDVVSVAEVAAVEQKSDAGRGRS